MIRDVIGAFNGAALQAAPTDIKFDCGAGMSRDFYVWVASGFTEAARRADGIINPVPTTPGAKRLEFTGALIAAVALPQLDKSLKNPAMMTVKISPDILRSTSLDPRAASGRRSNRGSSMISDFKSTGWKRRANRSPVSRLYGGKPGSRSGHSGLPARGRMNLQAGSSRP